MKSIKGREGQDMYPRWNSERQGVNYGILWIYIICR